MSAIEWTDVTWNPVRGCTRVSAGCEHCYAERMSARFSEPGKPFHGFAKPTKAGPRWTGRVELIPEKLDEPLRWRKPRKVFVNSMSDLFHEALPDEAIDQVFAVMAWARRHTYQVLTKRAERMLSYYAGMAALSPKERTLRMVASRYAGSLMERTIRHAPHEHVGELEWPFPWVWQGVSVEDQPTADERIPLLLQTPAAIRWVSYEPALGPVDFDGDPYSGPGWLCGYHAEPIHACGGDPILCARRCPEPEQTQNKRLDWVVMGGESGPGARPLDVEWSRSVVSQCRKASVACFVKQIGAHVHWDGMDGIGAWPQSEEQRIFWTDHDGAFCGRLRDPKGGDPSEWPEDLRVREFP